MLIKQIMSKPADTVSEQTTLQEAAQLMRKSDVGALPVLVDDNVAGIVTDRDLALRGVAEGLNMQETTVREVMTPSAICHYEDDEIERALESMQTHKVRRVVVLGQDKKPRGIVSLGDLVTRMDSNKHTQEVLKSVCNAGERLKT